MQNFINTHVQFKDLALLLSLHNENNIREISLQHNQYISDVKSLLLAIRNEIQAGIDNHVLSISTSYYSLNDQEVRYSCDLWYLDDRTTDDRIIEMLENLNKSWIDYKGTYSVISYTPAPVIVHILKKLKLEQKYNTLMKGIDKYKEQTKILTEHELKFNDINNSTTFIGILDLLKELWKIVDDSNKQVQELREVVDKQNREIDELKKVVDKQNQEINELREEVDEFIYDEEEDERNGNINNSTNTITNDNTKIITNDRINTIINTITNDNTNETTDEVDDTTEVETIISQPEIIVNRPEMTREEFKQSIDALIRQIIIDAFNSDLVCVSAYCHQVERIAHNRFIDYIYNEFKKGKDINTIRLSIWQEFTIHVVPRYKVNILRANQLSKGREQINIEYDI